MMRTPQQYVNEINEEVLPSFVQDISPSALALNDQYHADMQRMARNVGLNPDSLGYKASLLLACDLLNGLASALYHSEVEGKEIGAHFINEAAARLRILSLWGEQCHSLDLRQ